MYCWMLHSEIFFRVQPLVQNEMNFLKRFLEEILDQDQIFLKYLMMWKQRIVQMKCFGSVVQSFALYYFGFVAQQVWLLPLRPQ